MADIRALIVDDEPLARRGIRQLLAPYDDIAIAGECRDGREALRALATLKPDLVFLDIAMPGLDGLGVIRLHGAERMPMTVFVTAHDEFAVRAFEAHALDYLVKPISAHRFQNTIARVRNRMRTRDAIGLAGHLSALLQGEATRAGVSASGEATDIPIAVPTGTGGLLLDPADCEWIEASGDLACIHSRGTVHRLRESLHSLEQRLDPAQFVRIHRSIIVRLDQVRAWRSGEGGREGAVILKDGTTLPVSRRRMARVKSLLRPPGRRP